MTANEKRLREIARARRAALAAEAKKAADDEITVVMADRTAGTSRTELVAAADRVRKAR